MKNSPRSSRNVAGPILQTTKTILPAGNRVAKISFHRFAEADLMRRVMKPAEFRQWFARFLRNSRLDTKVTAATGNQ